MHRLTYMGVLFDYTQAEEAEPEMRCLGWFVRKNDCKSTRRLGQTAMTVSPHARTSQNWLFMKHVCLCVLEPCSQLHNSHLHCGCFVCVFVYCYTCAVPHISRRTCHFGLQYLPNHVICMFLQWTLQQMQWSFVLLSP